MAPDPAAGAPLRTPRRAATFALAAVWIAAAVPVAAWFAARLDPEAAVRAAQVAERWMHRLGVGALGCGVLALVIWPPFPAWVRLSFHRVRVALTSNRDPLHRAIGELRHFESAARHLEVGRLALQLGDLQLAAPHLQRAAELDPGLAATHHQIGLLLFRIGALGSALDAFTRAESIDPGHAFGDALLFGGRCYHLLGDERNAVAVLREHQRRHGGGRRAGYWLGEALLGAGDGAAAAVAFADVAAPPLQKLTPEENWFRARARVRTWRHRRSS